LNRSPKTKLQRNLVMLADNKVVQLRSQKAKLESTRRSSNKKAGPRYDGERTEDNRMGETPASKRAL